ncbi:hypothetical protein FE633_39935 [Streptomyces montanus]|uniref:Uncharacterized protein n=1 Tax=Streptomyces montanus TaxID=2580423 RepID=A0A5R9FAH1_9ACTN|nr:hypothetical protein FE633_39935 [Streptomyces montanus]
MTIRVYGEGARDGAAHGVVARPYGSGLDGCPVRHRGAAGSGAGADVGAMAGAGAGARGSTGPAGGGRCF